MRRIFMKYPFVMFDWGDTIMKDDPTQNVPMVEWPIVEAIDGAKEVLRTLHSHRMIVMATSADQSDEANIRLALQRVDLEGYFDRIYCFKNTGLRKTTEGFYRYILEDLKASSSEVLMIGDNFEGDVLAPNRAGIAAVWLNRKDAENRSGEQYVTVHNLQDLLLLFNETG
jgi:FMN phosphatase YigB (HAD superfamily)